MHQVVVNASMANQKIEKFLKKHLSEVPLNTIYKILRNKDVKVNNKRINKDYVVVEGDVVEIYLPFKVMEKEIPVIKTGKHFGVVYEDENVIFVNKEIGILTQKDNLNDISLTEEVVYYLYSKNEYDPSTSQGFAPSPAHRLDRNTCGIVMFGKSVQALNSLTTLIKQKTEVNKLYKALVFNRVLKDGEIKTSLVKDEVTKYVKVAKQDDEDALSAYTKYKVLRHYGECSLLEVELVSGRTHQIRVHLASINHPLVGDSKYGDFALNKKVEKEYQFKNQFLQAYLLRFGEVKGFLSYLANKSFTVRLPKVYNDLLEKLSDK